MYIQQMSDVVNSIAGSVWHWIDVDYDSPEQLAADIKRLIIQTQLEATEASDADILVWRKSLPINATDDIVYEIESIAGGPLSSIIYYVSDDEEFQTIREWRQMPTPEAALESN